MASSGKDVRDLCQQVWHPVLEHKLTMLRDKETTASSFRLIMEEISQYLAYEATRDLKLRALDVETPLEKTRGHLAGEELVLVPIMRAGNGMLSGMMRILPFARVGHVGIYRDKNINSTVEYYFRLPKEAQGKKVLLLDPLLATADTALAAVDRLKAYKVGAISFVCILASPVGIKKLKRYHPDVKIFTIHVDRTLNDKGYILPGLGDAGDRLYDTTT